MSFVYWAMVVTSDFGSESPGSSPGSPTKRDNLMKAIKDKKKFGGSGSSNSAMDAVGLKMLLDITKSFDKTSK